MRKPVETTTQKPAAGQKAAKRSPREVALANLPKDPVTGKIIKPANAGRKPGVKNKVTRDMREAVWQAFENAGGVEYLAKLAAKEPRTFGTMLVKLMPEKLEAELRGTLIVETGVTRDPGDE
jgi:hypothetical protein